MTSEGVDRGNPGDVGKSRDDAVPPLPEPPARDTDPVLSVPKPARWTRRACNWSRQFRRDNPETFCSRYGPRRAHPDFKIHGTSRVLRPGGPYEGETVHMTIIDEATHMSKLPDPEAPPAMSQSEEGYVRGVIDSLSTDTADPPGPDPALYSSSDPLTTCPTCGGLGLLTKLRYLEVTIEPPRWAELVVVMLALTVGGVLLALLLPVLFRGW